MEDGECSYANIKPNCAQGEFQTLKRERDESEPRVENAKKKKEGWQRRSKAREASNARTGRTRVI